MKDSINALRVILDNRYANISIMQRPGINILSEQFFERVKKNVPSRIGGAKLQQSGCTAGVKPKRDVQTDDLEPDAGATEHTGSAHRRTYFADESYGGKGQTERVRPRTYSTA